MWFDWEFVEIKIKIELIDKGFGSMKIMGNINLSINWGIRSIHLSIKWIDSKHKCADKFIDKLVDKFSDETWC